MKEDTGMQSSGIVIDNEPRDKALVLNKRRQFFQSVLASTPIKIGATTFLLTSLFAATFLVAYQTTKRNEIKAALHEIPEAEIVVPGTISRDNTPDEIPRTSCEGITGIHCQKGYTCTLNGDDDDYGGTCVPVSTELIDNGNPIAP